MIVVADRHTIMAFRYRWLMLVMCFVFSAEARFTCLDGNGNSLDWFIAIKVPKGAGPKDDDQYYFMTSEAPQWKLSGCPVDSTCGPIYKTVQQAYSTDTNNETVSILYNDEVPDHSTNSRLGHMKGVLVFNSGSTGFWMIHSVPKFPLADQYIYPSTGLRYGQHFICVTYAFSQLPPIARQLSIARPTTFAYNLPSSIAEKIPDLYSVVRMKSPRSKDSSLVQPLLSLGGTAFTHFSKPRSFNKDLYSDLVAPGLGTSLFMEGWVNGRGDLNSSCSETYKVFRVEKVNLIDEDWKTSKDHSKWAISEDGYKPWVCLGDINRQKSQFHRGGGTLCFNNKVVWTGFRKVVEKYQAC